jgi:hypothetical protein
MHIGSEADMILNSLLGKVNNGLMEFILDTIVSIYDYLHVLRKQNLQGTHTVFLMM